MFPLNCPLREEIKESFILINIYISNVCMYILRKREDSNITTHKWASASDWSCGLWPSNVTLLTDTDWPVTAMINEHPPANVSLMAFLVLCMPAHTHTLTHTLTHSHTDVHHSFLCTLLTCRLTLNLYFLILMLKGRVHVNVLMCAFSSKNVIPSNGYNKLLAALGNYCFLSYLPLNIKHST